MPREATVPVSEKLLREAFNELYEPTTLDIKKYLYKKGVNADVVSIRYYLRKYDLMDRVVTKKGHFNLKTLFNCIEEKPFQALLQRYGDGTYNINEIIEFVFRETNGEILISYTPMTKLMKHYGYKYKTHSREKFPNLMTKRVRKTYAERVKEYCIDNDIPLSNLSVQHIFQLNKALEFPLIMDHYIFCLHHRKPFNVEDLFKKENELQNSDDK